MAGGIKGHLPTAMLTQTAVNALDANAPFTLVSPWQPLTTQNDDVVPPGWNTRRIDNSSSTFASRPCWPFLSALFGLTLVPCAPTHSCTALRVVGGS